MIRKEFTIVFHLYSIDPQFTIPVTNEYGEDIEFNGNERDNLFNHITRSFRSICPELRIDPDDCANGPLLLRMTYYVGDREDYQYVLNFLTDSTPCQQRDPKVCAERKCLADNGELGRTWWIHHINLPNGQVIDVDRIDKETEDTIRLLLEKDLIEFLENKVPGFKLNSKNF